MRIALFTLSVLLIFASCDSRSNLEEDIFLTVTIPPLADFTKRIVGNRAIVNTLVPAGSNAHSFEPNPENLKLLLESEIYFRVGGVFTFENVLLDKIGGENINHIVDCSKNIEIMEKDPHIWLSPQNVRIITKTILEELVKSFPRHKNYFQNNRERYINKLDSIDTNLKQILKRKKGRTIFVYHPAWKYFAEYYNLVELYIEHDGKSPGTKELKEIFNDAKYRDLTCIYFDPLFDNSSVITIAESLNLEVDSLNPLPSDYLTNLIEITNKLDKYLK